MKGFNFQFFIPTKIVFGKGKIKEFSELFPEGKKRVLIVTGKSSAKKSGALDVVVDTLKKKGVEYLIFDKVKENPDFSVLKEGKEYAKKISAEIIVAIGGGSPMDSAKGIAVLKENEGSMEDYMSGKPLEKPPLSVICIPTTSGTGSEATQYAVFTNPKKKSKAGYAHPKIFPSLSIVDPELTYTMPENVIADTGFDALTHAIEAYLSTKSYVLNDVISMHSVEIILNNLLSAMEKNKEAMDMMSYSAMVAGIAISQAGTILLHALGYPLTVYYGISHGRANAIMFPYFMKFMLEKSNVKEKVETVLEILGGIDNFVKFIEKLGISVKMSDYGIKKEDIELFVKDTIVKKNLKITPAEITEDDLRKIYEEAL